MGNLFTARVGNILTALLGKVLTVGVEKSLSFTGTPEDRNETGKLGIRISFIPLGRTSKEIQKTDPWLKAKQKERNRIEGSFGNGKEHYGLNRVKYAGENGTEIWVRASLLAMNLKTALRRV